MKGQKPIMDFMFPIKSQHMYGMLFELFLHLFVNFDDNTIFIF